MAWWVFYLWRSGELLLAITVNFSKRAGGEVVNARVCKTCIRGFDSRPALQIQIETPSSLGDRTCQIAQHPLVRLLHSTFTLSLSHSPWPCSFASIYFQQSSGEFSFLMIGAAVCVPSFRSKIPD
jgi:hypothetical protein